MAFFQTSWADAHGAWSRHREGRLVVHAIALPGGWVCFAYKTPGYMFYTATARSLPLQGQISDSGRTLSEAKRAALEMVWRIEEQAELIGRAPARLKWTKIWRKVHDHPLSRFAIKLQRHQFRETHG